MPDWWSPQITLGDLLGVLASGVVGLAGWAYAAYQRRKAHSGMLRSNLLEAVQRRKRNTTIAGSLPVSAEWAELARLLPRRKAKRLRTLIKGYRAACGDTHCNELGEVLHTDPQRVRVYLLLLERLLRQPGL